MRGRSACTRISIAAKGDVVIRFLYIDWLSPDGG